MSAIAPSGPESVVGWLRRHERRLALAWLAAVALFAALLIVPPTRMRLLDALEGVSNRFDRRWEYRLAHGRSLVDEGRFEEAALYLERLDRTYPAPSVEHARDRERQLVLRLLARSYEGLGSGTRTMAAYDRLIAYAPEDYYNIFLKGQAAERMLSGWAIAIEARDAYAAVLALFPNHLPSVRGYIGYYADRGEYQPVAAAYAAYLDAFYVQQVHFTAGDTAVWIGVPADGKPHVVTVPLARPRAESLVINTNGYAFAVDSVSALPARIVGSRTAVRRISVAADTHRADGLTQAEHGAWRPAADSASLRIALPAAEAGLEDVRLVMRVFKPMDRPLWVVSARGFHNLLDDAGRAAAEARTVVFPRAAEADAVLERQGWYREGSAEPVVRR